MQETGDLAIALSEAMDGRRIVKAYADAAERVKAGGLDGFEIECYGHLIDQFWSPATNTRDDDYGGTLENRMRFAREVLQAIHFDGVRSQGYAFQVELTYRAVRAGFRVVEVPIVFRDRQRGQSKMSWHIAAEAMWLVPQLRFGRQPPAQTDTTLADRDLARLR